MKNIDMIKDLLLNDMEMTRGIVFEINGWDGSLENLRFEENDEEFFSVYFEGRPMEAVRAVSFGDYKYNDAYVKFNGYGNLETYSGYEVEEEIKSYIDDIVECIDRLRDNLQLPDEIESLLEEEEEE